MCKDPEDWQKHRKGTYRPNIVLINPTSLSLELQKVAHLSAHCNCNISESEVKDLASLRCTVYIKIKSALTCQEVHKRGTAKTATKIHLFIAHLPFIVVAYLIERK